MLDLHDLGRGAGVGCGPRSGPPSGGGPTALRHPDAKRSPATGPGPGGRFESAGRARSEYGFHRNQLGALTVAHAGLLEREDAVRTAETCRDLGWDAPADAYDAACFLSLCVPIVARHDKLDATHRKGAARLYGDAAMKLLRDAVSKGYIDVAHLKKDTERGIEA